MQEAEQKPLLSPRERRQRNRQEVIEAILAAARDIMRRDGVAALNLNEVARVVGMQPPSLYKYFPNKFAIYDALFQMGVGLFKEEDKRVGTSMAPSWERLEAWFEARLALAEEHFDLYHLVYDLPVPGFVPSAQSRQLVQEQVREGIQAIIEMMDAGIIAPALPADQAYDFLLALRRGIVAEHIGKRAMLSESRQDRFRRLVPHAIAMLKIAWAPAHPSGSERASTAAPAADRKEVIRQK